MRWIGWILAGLMLVVLIGIYQTKTAEVAETKADVASQIETKTKDVDQILSAAEESLLPLETRKKEEVAKTAGLKKTNGELSAKKTSLESSIAQLNATIESLTAAKDDTKESRQDSQAEIAELQKKITILEKQVRALVKAIASVSEKVGA
ncbi:MAG: hypothetical protein HN742_29295 [Lentisphaerae bacterium]|jgi:chromosome segregation ATPase|nr:hypothetical protein [Lentisphaerota bacterium]MBT4818059.1 hypothetical protein [Lentisphaerota bacterium]MBT5610239.1 hypothetical protein [Lentisphaerota bacterium]MBT7055708.1 hypothetical protein [Lentisphaerota bacterium]MBT7846003.1 hypothetical protein [Lentisphaerota bacterium]